LGGRAGVAPLPVGCVVVTEYRPGAQWRPRLLTPGETVLALLANTVPARRRPKAALVTLGAAVSHATALKGVRGETQQVVDELLEHLAA
jgi:hypothetical protein